MYGISREEQDEYFHLSHKRACHAIKDGSDEIVPVEVKSKGNHYIYLVNILGLT